MEACIPPGAEFYSSFVELVQHRATEQPTRWALAYLTDGDRQEVRRTYLQLDEAARAIAARIQRAHPPGQRALLFYQPGLEFVSALLGCFYAGVVAVPMRLPRPNHAATSLRSIVADAQPGLILTTSDLFTERSDQLLCDPLLRGPEWLPTDTIDLEVAESWQPPSITHDTIACLQYTSGSTADPKGVVLTHGNLLWNSQLILETFGHSPSSMGVIWLPHYHDMGLIGGILQPLFGGFPCVLLSPAHVVQRPWRWLQAISRYRATTSGGPNFIYDYCVENISDKRCRSLDLSSWEVAFNGAEPVREETLERFAERFAAYGFRRSTFFPCYGLAEATLLVSGGPKGTIHGSRYLDDSGQRQQRLESSSPSTAPARRVVSCGETMDDLKVRIVDPDTGTTRDEGEVGEIWLSGPTVAHGYWGRPKETRAKFGATLLGH